MARALLAAALIMAIPAAAVADDNPGAGMVSGAAAGAAGGAIIGGPIGAVIGGVGGAIVGGDAAQPQPGIPEYVETRGVTSYDWRKPVGGAAPAADDVAYCEVPPRYGTVSDRRALVDARPVLVDLVTRRIVEGID
jgi:hypothetical protein